MPTNPLSSVFDASLATIVTLILGLIALVLANVYRKKSRNEQQRKQQGECMVICGPSGVGKTSLFLLVCQGCLSVDESTTNTNANNTIDTHIPPTTISAECNSCKIKIKKETRILIDQPYHQRDKLKEASKIILVLDGVKPIGKEEISWITLVLAECIRKKSAVKLLLAVSKADLIKISPTEAIKKLKDEVNRQLAQQFKEEEEYLFEETDSDATSLSHSGNKHLRILRQSLSDNFHERPFDFFSSNFKILTYSKNSSKDLQEIISWLK